MHAKRFFSPLEISLELRYPLISMVWSPQPIERCLFQIWLHQRDFDFAIRNSQEIKLQSSCLQTDPFWVRQKRKDRACTAQLIEKKNSGQWFGHLFSTRPFLASWKSHPIYGFDLSCCNLYIPCTWSIDDILPKLWKRHCTAFKTLLSLLQSRGFALLGGISLLEHGPKTADSEAA